MSFDTLDNCAQLHTFRTEPRTERIGRPTHPPRQTSFSKRHASFDTPREVPFPSQTYIPTSSDLYESISPSKSSSTTPPANHTATTVTDGDNERASAVEHESSARITDTRNDNFPKGHLASTSQMLETPLTDGHMDPTVAKDAEGDHSGKDSQLSWRTASSIHPNELTGGKWDSVHLRPMLLHQSQSQVDEQVLKPSLSSPSPPTSPYLTENTEDAAIYAPTPQRPLSTESLPLPTQLPFCALPSLSVIPPFNPVQPEANVHSYKKTRTESPVASKRLHTSQANSLHRHLGSKARSPTSQPSSPTGLASPSQPFHSPSPPAFASLTPLSFVVSASRKSPPPASNDSTSSRNSSSSSSFPPPTPPTIHTPPPPPLHDPAEGDGVVSDGLRGLRTKRPPHEPFLSPAPPPIDSYISVETIEREYRLIVRLPGYKLDSITLATRRRRILHIVADSWDAGGGHFERRITFGYDADLAQVRAEFDGEHLRIVVPRRPPMGWWSNNAE